MATEITASEMLQKLKTLNNMPIFSEPNPTRDGTNKTLHQILKNKEGPLAHFFLTAWLLSRMETDNL